MNQVPKSNWFIACQTKELKKKTAFKSIIMGINIVLYRGDSGKVYALRNRCPHKNIELSLGRVDGEELSCRYHGWKFNGNGELLDIPCAAENEKLLNCMVEKYCIEEKDGWIWIWPDLSSSPIHKAPSYPKKKGFYWYEFTNTMLASMDLILENGLDCAHTGFVHKGLFRSEPDTFVDSLIERVPSGIKIKTFGEEKKNEKNKNLLAFASKGEEIVHTDEFIAPHTVYVEYENKNMGMITYLVCTPIDEFSTRVYTRNATKFKYLGILQNPIAKFLVNIVIKQDILILNNQYKLINEQGGKKDFRFSKSDTATKLFYGAFKKIQEERPLWGSNPKNIKLRYKL